MMWKLCKQLQGRRKAPQEWLAHAGAVFQRLGFEASPTCPCFFHHRERQITMALHMGDCHATGPTEALNWLRETFQPEFLTNHCIINRLRANYVHRKRERVHTEHGMFVRDGGKHVSKLFELMGMTGRASKPTPAVRFSADTLLEDKPELDDEGKARCQTAAGILMYYSQYRPDIQHIARVLGKKLSKPTQTEEAQLRRMIRYLVGTQDVGISFPAGSVPKEILGFSDADWAGEPVERKSCSAGAIMAGGCLLYSFSRARR